MSASNDDRAAQRLALLAELAELGMALVRTLADEVLGDKVSGVRCADPALAYARLSRAIRLTIALEARFDEDSRRAQAAHQDVTTLCARVQREEVGDMVARVIDETPEIDDQDVERLLIDLEERLEEREFETLIDRPVAVLAAQICKDLGMPFDPELWMEEEDLAELRALEARAAPANASLANANPADRKPAAPESERADRLQSVAWPPRATQKTDPP